MIDVAKFKEWIDSDEGKAHFENYMNNIKDRETMLESQLERFHANYAHRFEELMDKVIAKYDSDAYVKREYSLGYQPRESLFFFAYEYACKYGREATDEEYDKYGNMFTGDLRYVNGYIFNLMHGQGTVVNVYKE